MTAPEGWAEQLDARMLPPMTRPEWLDWRRGVVGASDIAIIMGWAPEEWRRTRAGLLEEKRGPYVPESEQKISEGKLRGRYLEPSILDWFQAEKARKPYWDDVHGVTGRTYAHPSAPWAIATPDAITVDGELVEAKTASRRDEWGRAGTDQVPLWYAAQGQWQMIVTGINVCHFPVLFGPGLQFRAFKIKANPAVQDHLLTVATRFHQEMTAP